ncbi:MAG: heme exporter protein CcmB [Bdellovibrionota bacterium]
MNSFITLFIKDIKIEFRSKDTLVLYSMLGVLLSVVIASGVSSSFVDRKSILQLFPTFIWLVFLLTGSFAISKIQEYEFSNGAYKRLLVSGVSLSKMFLAKVFSGVIVICFGFLVSLLALSVLLNVSILSELPVLLVLLLVAAIGFCSLSVLISPIALQSKMSSLLLPLMILPLLFPLFYGLLELSSQYFTQQHNIFSSMWFTLLVGLDVLYLLLGMNLYQHVLRE